MCNACGVKLEARQCLHVLQLRGRYATDGATRRQHAGMEQGSRRRRAATVIGTAELPLHAHAFAQCMALVPTVTQTPYPRRPKSAAFGRLQSLFVRAQVFGAVILNAALHFHTSRHTPATPGNDHGAARQRHHGCRKGMCSSELPGLRARARAVRRLWQWVSKPWLRRTGLSGVDSGLVRRRHRQQPLYTRRRTVCQDFQFALRNVPHVYRV